MKSRKIFNLFLEIWHLSIFIMYSIACCQLTRQVDEMHFHFLNVMRSKIFQIPFLVACFPLKQYCMKIIVQGKNGMLASYMQIGIKKYRAWLESDQFICTMVIERCVKQHLRTNVQMSILRLSKTGDLRVVQKRS